MQASQSNPAARAALWKVALYLLGVAGLAAGITLLFFGQRAVMDIGGFCAEGGPYVIETTCPEGTSAAMLLGTFGGLAGFFVAMWAGASLGPRAVGLLFLAWPALFGALGFNFLQYGFDPPGDDAGWAWGWLVCGVVFWVMAFGPLLLAAWTGSVGGARPTPRDAGPRLARSAPGGTRLASRSLARARSVPPAPDPLGTFPLPMPPDDRPPAGAPDLVDGLERLAALHRSGSLTDDEYARAKAELLEAAGA